MNKRKMLLTGFYIAFLVALLCFFEFSSSGNKIVLTVGMAAIFVGGLCLGAKVAIEKNAGVIVDYEEIPEGVYSYKGNVGGIYILRHVDSKGNDTYLAVNSCPLAMDIAVGQAFRKTGESMLSKL